jgi:hypothetical protein
LTRRDHYQPPDPWKKYLSLARRRRVAVVAIGFASMATRMANEAMPSANVASRR